MMQRHQQRTNQAFISGRRPQRGRLVYESARRVGLLPHSPYPRAWKGTLGTGSKRIRSSARPAVCVALGENQNREIRCGRVRRRGGRADARRQERGPLARSRNDFGHGHCATTPDRASHTTLLYSSIDILSPAAPRVHYAMYAAAAAAGSLPYVFIRSEPPWKLTYFRANTCPWLVSLPPLLGPTRCRRRSVVAKRKMHALAAGGDGGVMQPVRHTCPRDCLYTLCATATPRLCFVRSVSSPEICISAFVRWLSAFVL